MLYLQVLEQLGKDVSNTGSVFVDETRGAQSAKHVKHNVISNIFSNSLHGKYFQQRNNPWYDVYRFLFVKFGPLIVKYLLAV